MQIVSRFFIIFILSISFINIQDTYADTFGESCSALPIAVDSDITDTAYGVIKNNIDMKTYVKGGCNSGNSILTFCLRNESGAAETCTQHSMNIDDRVILGSISSNPNLGKNWLLKDIVLEVKVIESDVCLVMPTVKGMMPLMCRSKEGTDVLPPDNKPDVCKRIGQSCYDGKSKSQSLLSFSGLTVNCFRNALDKVFYVGNDCPAGSDESYTALRPFPEFQDTMRVTVLIALILAVIVYGLKILMNNEHVHLDKAAMFIIKLILVIYFAIGFGQKSLQYGKEVRQNGMTKDALPLLVNLTSGFAEMVFMAGGSQGLCDFDESKYESGYEFYKLWDAIDCRVGYYLGLQALYNIGSILDGSPSSISKGGQYTAIDFGPKGKHGIESLSQAGSFSFFSVMFGMFMSGYIIIVVLGLLFVIFLVSVLLYFITAYLVCMVTLYVMAYISPIFIPMALFDRTKSYFDAWLRIVISCTIQPAVIAGFIALLLTIYDSAIYGTCEFQRHDYSVGEIKFSTFALAEPSSEPEKCTNSMGYKLVHYYLGQGWEKKIVIIFEITRLKDYLDFGTSLLYVMVYMFIFYFFIKSVNEFASDLTGGPSVATVTVSPTAIIDKAKNIAVAAVALAKSAAKAAAGDGQGAAEDAKEAGDELAEDTTSNVEEGGDDKGRGGAVDKISSATGAGGSSGGSGISGGGGS